MVEAGNRTGAARTAPVPVLALGLGLGIVAVVARFLTRSPLWLDEALSANIAGLPLRSIPEALRHDGHPPLYYFALHGWMRAFGETDVAVRALSGVLAVAALPVAWLVGRRVGGTRVAWATTLLLALSPFAVRYATETRMYALVILLVLVGHLVVRTAVDERRVAPARLAVLAVVTACLVLTHYWSLFLGIAVVAVLAWWGRRAGSSERRVALRLALAIAVGGLAFVLWLLSFLEQAAHTGTPWSAPARPTVVLNDTIHDFAGGGTRAEAGLLGVLLVVLVLLGLFARAPRGRGAAGAEGRRAPAGDGDDDGDGDDGDEAESSLHLLARPAHTVAGEAAVATLTLAIGAFVGLVTASAFASRYASVVFPLVIVIGGRGLAVVPRGRPAAVVAALVVALSLVGIAGNVVDHRTQAGRHAEAIAAGAVDPARDAVVVCPDQLGPATRRALDRAGLGTLPLLAYPTLDDGRFVDWYDYGDRNAAVDPTAVAAEIAGAADAGGRLWVISNPSYRTFEGDCERLIDALTAARGVPTLVQADGGSEFFEHATLIRFEPVAR